MLEIYTAILARLDDQIVTSVYGHVPQNSAYPYIVLGDLSNVITGTDDDTEYEADFSVISYTRYRGTKAAADLNLEVQNALHRWDMPDTTTYGISTIHAIFSQVLAESDGITRQGLLRFKILFEAKA